MSAESEYNESVSVVEEQCSCGCGWRRKQDTMDLGNGWSMLSKCASRGAVLRGTTLRQTVEFWVNDGELEVEFGDADAPSATVPINALRLLLDSVGESEKGFSQSENPKKDT